jgi:hypothetical protein
VIRRHHRQRALIREPASIFERGLKIVAIFDQFGSQSAHRAFFSTLLPCGTTIVARSPWRRAA